MTCIFYTLGLILLSGITYLLRDWRSLALATSVPFLLYYFYWFVLPESPRWLLMRERLEEANTILSQIARVNKKELPEEFTSKLHKMVMEQKERGKKCTKNISAFALFKTPNMRLKTCLITLNWCASEMVYVGLSYYGPAIGNNQYVSFFFSSAVEIPSYLVCWVLMDRVGRRWPLCLSMVISGIFCITTVLLPNGWYVY
jgi:MFS family permease